MQTDHSELGDKAFGKHANSKLIVGYDSHQDALRSMAAAIRRSNGIAALSGPAGSGKTTLIHEQRDWELQNSAVAVIAGANLSPRRMLTTMLSQFGITTTSQHDDHLLQLLSNFLNRRTRGGHAPLLILDDADRASPSALRLLNWLAALEANNEFALRIILTGKEKLAALVHNDSMRSVGRRHPVVYSLNPLSAQETMIYLRTRFIAAGGNDVDKVFPVNVCEKVHELSGGWPGSINQLAVEVLDRMRELRSARPIPRIVVSKDGSKVAEYELTEKQYVIGRNTLSDICIEDAYVSKMHAMLQVYPNAVVLLDLNSTNGTTVNSRVTQRTILRNDDVITLGHYRLKVENVPAISPEMDQRIKASDTVTMQTLEDIRRTRAKRTIKLMKVK